MGAGEGVAVEFTVSLEVEGLWERVDVTEGELAGVLLFDLTNFEIPIWLLGASHLFRGIAHYVFNLFASFLVQVIFE